MSSPSYSALCVRPAGVCWVFLCPWGGGSCRYRPRHCRRLRWPRMLRWEGPSLFSGGIWVRLLWALPYVFGRIRPRSPPARGFSWACRLCFEPFAGVNRLNRQDSHGRVMLASSPVTEGGPQLACGRRGGRITPGGHGPPRTRRPLTALRAPFAPSRGRTRAGPAWRLGGRDAVSQLWGPGGFRWWMCRLPPLPSGGGALSSSPTRWAWGP